MSDETTKPLRFFVSYSHKDESYKDDLTTHLSSLIRSGAIASWDDRQIPIGDEWDHEIKTEMNEADVILLLISADFLNSSYCNDVEVTRAMERHHDPNDPARVVPVILRHCDWTDTSFAKLQALPKNAQPISSFSDKDEAYLYIVKQIKGLIQRRSKSSSKPKPTVTNKPKVAAAPVPPPATPAATSKEELDQIRDLIATNKLDKAIETMSTIAKQKDGDLYNAILAQSNRLSSVKKNNMLGISTTSESNREQAKIVYALLELLKDL